MWPMLAHLNSIHCGSLQLLGACHGFPRVGIIGIRIKEEDISSRAIWLSVNEARQAVGRGRASEGANEKIFAEQNMAIHARESRKPRAHDKGARRVASSPRGAIYEVERVPRRGRKVNKWVSPVKVPHVCLNDVGRQPVPAPTYGQAATNVSRQPSEARPCPPKHKHALPTDRPVTAYFDERGVVEHRGRWRDRAARTTTSRAARSSGGDCEKNMSEEARRMMRRAHDEGEDGSREHETLGNEGKRFYTPHGNFRDFEF
ncbi:hypothetical protein FB451DRAFT_1175799 [Mycena latifolia]|nr:hypothetical protein FB451DRAFT_1175799 [Mycena latifolia]